MSEDFISRAALGLRWGKHPTTAVRLMERFGVAGLKLGDSSQSSRFFALKDVFRVEKLANLKARGKLSLKRQK